MVFGALAKTRCGKVGEKLVRDDEVSDVFHTISGLVMLLHREPPNVAKLPDRVLGEGSLVHATPRSPTFDIPASGETDLSLRSNPEE